MKLDGVTKICVITLLYSKISIIALRYTKICAITLCTIKNFCCPKYNSSLSFSSINLNKYKINTTLNHKNDNIKFINLNI